MTPIAKSTIRKVTFCLLLFTVSLCAENFLGVRLDVCDRERNARIDFNAVTNRFHALHERKACSMLITEIDLTPAVSQARP